MGISINLIYRKGTLSQDKAVMVGKEGTVIHISLYRGMFGISWVAR